MLQRELVTLLKLALEETQMFLLVALEELDYSILETFTLLEVEDNLQIIQLVELLVSEEDLGLEFHSRMQMQ